MTRTLKRIARYSACIILGFSAATLIGIFAYSRVGVSALDVAVEEFEPTKSLSIKGDKLVIGNLPEGVKKAKIYASTYEQLIDLDGNVRHPISDSATKLTIELADEAGRTKCTSSFDFAVPAKTQPFTNEGNLKPTVVPAIQEWVGDEGLFDSAGQKLVVVVSARSKADKADLAERAEFFAKELSAIFGKKVPVTTEEPKDGTPFISLVVQSNPETKRLGEEGYTLVAQPSSLTITSLSPRGAFWGTRTVLQVFAQTENTFPCGIAVDYPQYPLRGFVIDAGRKPISLKMLYDITFLMSYYKLNDFQIHLNDNFIWLHEYTEIPNTKDATDEQKKQAIEEVLNAAPTAFRLESDLVGKNGIPLTATDVFYTKEEFSALLSRAKTLGVSIVPEIDVPGHALSFVRVRPDLMYHGKITKPNDVERVAMLDASEAVFSGRKTYREETLEFVKDVFDEYLVGKKGKKAVFADAGAVHIGTDEYYGNADDYRAFANAMLKHIKKRGYTPRLWGSFSMKKSGETSIDGKGMQIDIWNFKWQHPTSALALGFDIINILDSTSYVVPSGDGSRGGYGDVLDLEKLYAPTWQPHIFEKATVPAGYKGLLGAQWALWNDNQFRRATGLTDYDFFDRIRRSCAVFAEKNWNTGKDLPFHAFMKLVDDVGDEPLSNPEYKVKNPENGILFEQEFERVRTRGEGIFGKSLVLNGSRKVKLSPKNKPVYGIAPGYVAEFYVKRAAGTPAAKGNQVIFGNGIGNAVCAAMKNSGKFGVIIDFREFYFDYTLPENQWVKIQLVCGNRELTLYADGKKIGTPHRVEFPETCKFTSFVFPVLYAGDVDGNGFVGEIDSLLIMNAEGAGKRDARSPLAEAARKAKKFAGKNNAEAVNSVLKKYEAEIADSHCAADKQLAAKAEIVTALTTVETPKASDKTEAKTDSAEAPDAKADQTASAKEKSAKKNAAKKDEKTDENADSVPVNEVEEFADEETEIEELEEEASDEGKADEAPDAKAVPATEADAATEAAQTPDAAPATEAVPAPEAVPANA